MFQFQTPIIRKLCSWWSTVEDEASLVYRNITFQDDCKMGVHLSMPFLGSDLCHLSRMSHTVYKILQGYRILSPNFISSRDYKTLLQLVEWCWESSISSLHKSYFLRRLWTWEIKSGNHPSAGSDFCNPSRTRWVPTPVETVSGFYSTW